MLLASAVALICALSGCGGGPDDRTLARAGLIRLADLPAIAVKADKAFENRSCDPTMKFRVAGGLVATSPGFDVANTKVEQAVAVFGASSDASDVHGALTSRQRLSCIRSAFRQEIEKRVGDPVEVSVKLSRRALGEYPASRLTLTSTNVSGSVSLHYAATGRAVTAIAVFARSDEGADLGDDLARASLGRLADLQ
jgi:hypothetical protein